MSDWVTNRHNPNIPFFIDFTPKVWCATVNVPDEIKKNSEFSGYSFSQRDKWKLEFVQDEHGFLELNYRFDQELPAEGYELAFERFRAAIFEHYKSELLDQITFSELAVAPTRVSMDVNALAKAVGNTPWSDENGSVFFVRTGSNEFTLRAVDDKWHQKEIGTVAFVVVDQGWIDFGGHEFRMERHGFEELVSNAKGVASGADTRFVEFSIPEPDANCWSAITLEGPSRDPESVADRLPDHKATAWHVGLQGPTRPSGLSKPGERTQSKTSLSM